MPGNARTREGDARGGGLVAPDLAPVRDHGAMAADDEGRWPKQLVMSLGITLVVAVVLGVVIGIVVLGAVKMSGVDTAGAGLSQAPTLVMPSGKPTTTVRPYPADIDQSLSPTPTPSPSASPSASATSSSPSPSPKRRRHPVPAISLRAYPGQVAPGARINLTGTYPRGEGTVLQVQELQSGSWNDFPVTVTVSGGTFSTYVITSYTGPTEFRVLDQASGRHSNPVTVQIG